MQYYNIVEALSIRSIWGLKFANIISVSSSEKIEWFKVFPFFALKGLEYLLGTGTGQRSTPTTVLRSTPYSVDTIVDYIYLAVRRQLSDTFLPAHCSCQVNTPVVP
jgi:hypothetical protein